MFCANCGNEIEKSSKFCHHCGDKSSISKKSNKTKQTEEPRVDVNIDSSRESVDEYQARTDIKDKKEAKRYLIKLRILFWVVFLSMMVIRGVGEVESDALFILFVPYIGLLIYFIIFCAGLLKAERLSRLNALWCIFFAPLSWFYVYPLMADPLKIILGKKQPPMRLSDTERKQREAIVNKKFWRNFWILMGSLAGIIILFIVLVLI